MTLRMGNVVEKALTEQRKRCGRKKVLSSDCRNFHVN
jgi:hypothetical protein